MAGNICQKCFMKTMLIAFNPPMFTLSPSLILTKVHLQTEGEAIKVSFTKNRED